MSKTEWCISDVVLEAPSEWVGRPHELVGKGKVHIVGCCLHFVVRPRGLSGLLPTSERCAFPGREVTAFQVLLAFVITTSCSTSGSPAFELASVEPRVPTTKQSVPVGQLTGYAVTY